jgi:RQC domain
MCPGSKSAKIKESGHEKSCLFGGSSKFGLDRTDTERLFRQLIICGAIDEELRVTAQDHTVCYVRLGTRANDLMAGRFKVRVMSDYDPGLRIRQLKYK